MLPLGKCLRPIPLVAAMVNEFVKATQNTNKTQPLASNYGTFRLLVVPQTGPSTQLIDALSCINSETAQLELENSAIFLAIKHCQQTKIRKVINLS
jgi:hypothetical protein